MIIYRIKAVDHYSNDEHVLQIQYLLAYGSLIENNPFYFKIKAFWLFILDSDNMYRFHPLSWESPELNILQSNIVKMETIEI